MNWQTKNVVVGDALLLAYLAALSARPAAALLGATPKLRLSQDPDVNIVTGAALADLEAGECDFSGYAAGGVAVVVSVPLTLEVPAKGVLQNALFIAATATPFVPNTVTAWWVDDGTNFMFGEKFASDITVPLGAPGDWLDLEMVLPLSYFQRAAA